MHEMSDRPGDHAPRADPALPEADTDGPRPDAAQSSQTGDLDSALRAARAGDEGGFIELWRALQPPLLRYLTVRGEDSPDDLASETWLQVIRDLPKFRGNQTDFRAWLFTLARNRAVDAGRRRSARPVVPVAEPEVTATDPSAETLALESLSTQDALELVATLPAAQAEMVMLRVVAGLDAAAVGAILGKQPGAVRTGVHRGLKTLATRLEVTR